MTVLQRLFETPGKKLIGYVPAGFPTINGAKEIIKAMVDGGVDAIEVGFPYSDPVMDGPTIQAAADKSLRIVCNASPLIPKVLGLEPGLLANEEKLPIMLLTVLLIAGT